MDNWHQGGSVNDLPILPSSLNTRNTETHQIQMIASASSAISTSDIQLVSPSAVQTNSFLPTGIDLSPHASQFVPKQAATNGKKKSMMRSTIIGPVIAEKKS